MTYTRNLFKGLSTFIFIGLIQMMVVSIGNAATGQTLPFSEGETVTFAIKKFGAKAGTARLTFNGKERLNDREVYRITFTAKAPKFFDEEKIYMDPKTFYPLMVKRDINIWGKKEKIVERYFHDRGIVKITKYARGKTKEQIISKDKRIDNIYCFIYRFRLQGQSRPGDSYEMYLPTKDVKIKFVDSRKVKVAREVYDAYYLESRPRQYRIWFDTSGKRIPLRIDGAVGLIRTSMFFREYQE